MNNKNTSKPLEGILVLEFCQYLSGPSAGLRLADLGARVIKIENPNKGDLCRILPIKDQWVDDNSLLFHTINRNKQSYTANLKSDSELESVKGLIAKADVLIHNFRPGVMEKLGLSFDQLEAVNSTLVYAEISGYGSHGPWAKKPGQDLLLQAMSGLMYASGNQDEAPTPFGLAIGDMLCGAHVVQAILAAIWRRNRTNKSIKIQVSLLESLIDFQFELFTTYFTSGKLPQRSAISNAHSLLAAPYGIYQTKDSYIALAMIPLENLKLCINCEGLMAYDQSMVFSKRDEIKAILATFFINQSTAGVMEKFKSRGIWAAELKNWKKLKGEQGYKQLELEQFIKTNNQKTIKTTRCPIRFDGEILWGMSAAPELGQHTDEIQKEFSL